MIRALLSLVLFRVLGAKVMLALSALRWLRGRNSSRGSATGRTR